MTRSFYNVIRSFYNAIRSCSMMIRSFYWKRLVLKKGKYGCARPEGLSSWNIEKVALGNRKKRFMLRLEAFVM
jgi:hypothetical protein